MLKKLYNWIKGLFSKKQPLKKVVDKRTHRYDYEFIDDVPDEVRAGVIYLVQNQGYCWQSVMDCPCGCKSVLFMNHVEDFNPSWSHQINENNLITLYPSVDRMVDCKSHFWVTDGKIIWV